MKRLLSAIAGIASFGVAYYFGTGALLTLLALLYTAPGAAADEGQQRLIHYGAAFLAASVAAALFLGRALNEPWTRRNYIASIESRGKTEMKEPIMKKLTLALLAILLPIAVYAGPVALVQAPAPPPADLFKAGEFDLSGFGSGLWTKDPYRTDRYFAVDHTFGGGLAGKYFFTKNFGAGMSFSGYDVKNLLTKVDRNAGDRRFVGDFLLNATFRYPIGSFAPYVSLGAGGMFNGGNKTLKEPSGTIGKKLRFELVEHDVKLLAEGALGVEYRLNQNWGIFSEAAFDKIDRPHSNSMTLRTGINFAF